MNVKTRIRFTLWRLRKAQRDALAACRLSWTSGDTVHSLTHTELERRGEEAYESGYDVGQGHGYLHGHRVGHEHGRQTAIRMRKENAADTGILAAALHALMIEAGRTRIEFPAPLARFGPDVFGIDPTESTGLRATEQRGRLVVEISPG